MNYSKLYSFCIGEVGLKADEYWSLTEAETMAKIAGYMINNSIQASNFRNLYGAMIKLWSKEKQSVEKLWPIATDYKEDTLSVEEMYERNRKILKA